MENKRKIWVGIILGVFLAIAVTAISLAFLSKDNKNNTRNSEIQTIVDNTINDSDTNEIKIDENLFDIDGKTDSAQSSGSEVDKSVMEIDQILSVTNDGTSIGSEFDI